MSERELVVLGTASQVPTRERNHNGYVLVWDGDAILFDPGEGTQRQLTLAGFAPPKITRICITHLHGDHCLGLPGLLQRLALDGSRREVGLWYPAEGAMAIAGLRRVAGADGVPVVEHPCGEGVLDTSAGWRLVARHLDHRIPTLAYRIDEPDGRRMLPDRLAALGIEGPAIGRLQSAGRLEVGGRVVAVEEVSEPRPGQAFAFVMDTRLCDAAVEIAADADLLVCEATFLSEHAELADRFGHLTAADAGVVARDAGARRLVLTHFSQRYALVGQRAVAEASAVFDGDIIAAEDLSRVPVPPRP